MKKLLLGVLTTACALSFGGCSLAAKSTVRDINDNSDFAIDLLTKAEDLDLSGFGIIPGYGIDGYYDLKYGNFEEDPSEMDGVPMVRYDVSGWPDTLGERYVTGISCSDPAVKLYGFSVGDSFAAFEEFLTEEKDFEKYYDTLWFAKFRKGKVEIRCGVDYDTGLIRDYFVGVRSSNLFGVVY